MEQPMLPGDRPQAGTGVPPAAGGMIQSVERQRRITRLIGFSLALLGAFLIIVCVASWMGLLRFQSSLTLITENDLPRVVGTVNRAMHLNNLLVAAERLAQVETEAARRVAYDAMTAEFDYLTGTDGDGADAGTPGPQLAGIMESARTLNSLVGERLKLEQERERRLSRMDSLSMSLWSIRGIAKQGAEALAHADAAGELMAMIAELRLFLHEEKTVALGRKEKQIKSMLDSMMARLPAGHAGLADAVAELRDILLARDDGMLALTGGLMRLGSEISSLHSIMRGMMEDLANGQVTRFNQLVASADGIAQTTNTELRSFASFFLVIGVVALLMSFGVYLHFRKAFIIRLERLNEAVLAGVRGEEVAIDTSGSDEIATIARSVDYFTRELKISMRHAEASNQAKSAFLANMSHEIRTPMNAIIGFTRMASETELSRAQHGYIKKIESAARFLLSIINDILDFSKIEAGKLDVEVIPFEPAAIIGSVADAGRSKAESKGLAFDLAVDPELPPVLLGDPVRIFQILNNLCDNAVKFTEQGKVSLAVRVEERSGEQVRASFTVEDQGIGLTGEQLGKLFQPFSQADVSTTRRFGGTGLGLTISKSLCEMMGGSIEVRSEYGHGSAFRFELPLGVSAESIGRTASDGAPPDLSGKRVLLAEDNLINQEIVLALLEKTGVEVDVANDGREALDLLAKNDYALVLMDVQMPVMDGLAATRFIRTMGDENKAQVPIIAMTAHAMTDDRKNCLEAGMNDHVAKPIEPAELFSVLDKWSSLYALQPLSE